MIVCAIDENMIVMWTRIGFLFLLGADYILQCYGGCIRQESLDPVLPLNGMNFSTCVSLRQRTGQQITESDVTITRLSVTQSCVRSQHVELKVVVSGRRACSAQRILFTWHNESGCPWMQPCSGYHLEYKQDWNVTICLIKCPKNSSSDDDSFGIDLTGGFSYTGWSVCGLQIYTEHWRTPASWNSSDLPSVYLNFESSLWLSLRNGATLVADQLSNLAVSTKKAFHQWVSLGNLSQVTCLPQPWTCGPDGASLSVWMKIPDCHTGLSEYNGYISSIDSQGRNGFHCFCLNNHLRIQIHPGNRGYFVCGNIAIPDGWFHVALVYHGPVTGQGITVHSDGNHWTKRSRDDSSSDLINSSGTVVIGNLFTEPTGSYGSVMVDELTFWDRQLTDSEVDALRNTVY